MINKKKLHENIARPLSLELLNATKRYLPWLLGISLLIYLLTLIIVSLSEGSLVIPNDLNIYVVISDIIILPMSGIYTSILLRHLLVNRKEKTLKILLSYIVSPVFTVLIISTAFQFLYADFGYVDNDIIALGSFKLDPLESNVISNGFIALLCAIPISIWVSRLDNMKYELVKTEKEKETLARMRTEAELGSLQSRVNPHFLFNSLNSIASLVHTRPDDAERMTVGLSDLLRYSLNSASETMSSIEDEINISRKYLEIEKIRFVNRLEYNFDIEDGLKRFMIPRFLLQPIIENAVKHGVADNTKGRIEILISRKEDNILIAVKDNGTDFPDIIEIGFGLNSTNEKLRLIYGEEADVELISGANKQVSIILPITEKARRNENV